MSEFDPFEFETGLLSNYVGVVTDAWFTFDPKYNQGQSLIMKWKMKTDQPGEQSEWVESWPVGSEWKTLDGGKTAEHPKGAEKTFNQAAQYTKVLMKLKELGAIDQLKAMGRRDPRVASFALGIKARFEQVEVGTNMSTKEPIRKNLPVEFFGVEDVAGGGVTGGVTTAPVQQTTAPAPAATNGYVDLEMKDLPGNVQVRIKELAQQMNHSDWVDAVLATDPVPNHLNVVMALSAEDGLYARLRS